MNRDIRIDNTSGATVYVSRGERLLLTLRPGEFATVRHDGTTELLYALHADGTPAMVKASGRVS